MFESDQPESALQRVMEANAAEEEYGPWIFAELQGVFGMDPSQGIPPLPEKVYDSGRLEPVAE